VQLFGVEAAGKGLSSGYSAATTALGREGVLHGSKTLLMQTGDGQIEEAHSISAGLDYPGIGPQHAHLWKSGRVTYLSATDEESLVAARDLACTEGIIPALESAHAFAVLGRLPVKQGGTVVVILSGRGDKDMQTYAERC
jgi:tryptophan synthase beta chain